MKLTQDMLEYIDRHQQEAFDLLVTLALFDYRFDSVERSAAYEENVLCVYLNEFLIGMLSSALRRNVSGCSFKNF